MFSLSISPEVCSAGDSSQGSSDDLALMLGLRELAGSVREKILLDYNSYMAHFITPESCSLTPSPCHSEPGSPINTKRVSNPENPCQNLNTQRTTFADHFNMNTVHLLIHEIVQPANGRIGLS